MQILVVIGLALAACTTAVAQKQSSREDITVFPTGQWTPMGLLVSAWFSPTYLIKGKRAAELKGAEAPLQTMLGFDPKAPKVMAMKPKDREKLVDVFQPRNQGSKIFHLQDRFWQNTWVTGTATLWRRDPGSAWERSLEFQTAGCKYRPTILPLANGKFLVVNPPPFKDSTGQAKQHPLGIFRTNAKGELDQESPIELEKGEFHKNDAFRRMLIFLDTCVVVEDRLVLCCPQYGMFWVLSLEDGRVLRSAKLYGDALDGLVAANRGHRLIINLQPLKSGEILLAARNPETAKTFIKDATKAQEHLQLPPGSEPSKGQVQQILDLRERSMEVAYMDHHEVFWYEFRPRSGTFHRLPSGPVGGRGFIASLKDFEDFYWIPDAEDRITFTDRTFSKWPRAEMKDLPSPRR